MGAEKAIERVNKLEEIFDAFETKFLKQISYIIALIRPPHMEEPSVDAHIEG